MLGGGAGWEAAGPGSGPRLARFASAEAATRAGAVTRARAGVYVCGALAVAAMVRVRMMLSRCCFFCDVISPPPLVVVRVD